MAKQKSTKCGKSAVVRIDRRKSSERRGTTNRRQTTVAVAQERRRTSERRTNRRRQIDPTTCERDYSPAEVEFMHALDAYKRVSGRMFPTCSEILEVVQSLGYEKRDSSSTSTPIAIDGEFEAGLAATAST